ncbi:hypothetical protein MHYP_G00296670 [Metynnis hypsauchen]
MPVREPFPGHNPGGWAPTAWARGPPQGVRARWLLGLKFFTWELSADSLLQPFYLTARGLSAARYIPVIILMASRAEFGGRGGPG